MTSASPAAADRIGEKAGEQRRQRVAGLAHPDHAPPAHQADLRRFVGEPRGIAGEGGGGEFGDAERVVQIGADRSRQRVGPLADEAGIGAIKQHRADLGVGAAQQGLDPRGGSFTAWSPRAGRLAVGSARGAA